MQPTTLLRQAGRRTASLAVAIIWLMCATDTSAGVDLTVPKATNLKKLDRWLIAGPLVEELTDSALRFPGIAGHRCITAEDFRKACSTLDANIRVRRLDLSDAKTSLDFHEELGAAEAQAGFAESFYAACSVVSDSPRNLYAVIGNDDWLAIFVNGILVDSSKITHSGTNPNYISELPLQRGENLILIRIMNKSGGAGLKVTLTASFEEALADAAVASQSFLETMIIPAGTSPAVRIPTSLVGRSAEVILSNTRGEQIWRGTVALNASSEPAAIAPIGLHKATMLANGVRIEIPCCIGDPRELYLQLKNTIALTEVQEDQAATCEILKRRMEILFDPSNSKPQELNWQFKVVTTLRDLAALVDSSNMEPRRLPPGVHIRGFRSRIDGNTESYRCFVPSVAAHNDAGPVPLIIILPAVVSSSRPFVESPMIAAHLTAEHMGRLAEVAGAAILWAGYRNQPFGSPCEFTHLDEVISDFSNRCKIDPARVSLVGACSSGVTAMMAAVQWQNRFSAVVLENAVMHREQNSYEDDGRFNGFRDYWRWIGEMDPQPRLLSLGQKCPPILIVNGQEDDVAYKDAMSFLNTARKAGMRVTHRVWPPFYGQQETSSLIFPWCVSQKLDAPLPTPSDGLYSAHGSVGPIARFFDDAFIVVVGTRGSKEDQVAMQRIAATFQDAWRAVHFGPCRQKMDFEVTPDEKRTMNILLIGNEQANSLWAEISESLSCRISVNQIRIDGIRLDGNSFGVQAIEQSPFSHDHRLLLLGAQVLPGSRFRSLNLSIDGWYDYSILSFKGGASQLVAASHYGAKRRYSNQAAISSGGP